MNKVRSLGGCLSLLWLAGIAACATPDTSTGEENGGVCEEPGGCKPQYFRIPEGGGTIIDDHTLVLHPGVTPEISNGPSPAKEEQDDAGTVLVCIPNPTCGSSCNVTRIGTNSYSCGCPVKQGGSCRWLVGAQN